MDLSNLASCIELSSVHLDRAVGSASAMERLLARAAEIGRPGEGCPKILPALARLADDGCAWVEGDVRIELSGDDARTELAVFADHGFGIRERLLPTVTFRVPLGEFVQAITLDPELIAPLQARPAAGKVVLSRSAEPSAPPPPRYEPKEESVNENERVTAPPSAAVAEALQDAASDIHSRPTKPMPTADPEAIRRARAPSEPGSDNEGEG
jgi:hypothetical protein